MRNTPLTLTLLIFAALSITALYGTASCVLSNSPAQAQENDRREDSQEEKSSAQLKVENLLNITSRAMLLGDHPYAVHAARQALEHAHTTSNNNPTNPNHTLLLQALGSLGEAYRANNECRKALVILDRAIHLVEQNPNSIPPPALASLFLWRGDCARQNGNTKLANNDLKRVNIIANNPNNPNHSTALKLLTLNAELASAELLVLTHNPTTADQALEKLLNKIQNNPANTNNDTAHPLILKIWSARARIYVLNETNQQNNTPSSLNSALNTARKLAINGGARTWTDVAKIFQLSALASRIQGDEANASQFFEAEGAAWLQSAREIENAQLNIIKITHNTTNNPQPKPADGAFAEAAAAFAEAFFAQYSNNSGKKPTDKQAQERLQRLANVSRESAARAFGPKSKTLNQLEQRLKSIGGEPPQP
ncbi:MAG: hypothetical protein OD811_06565 [Alphaproteobacteria bacterium]